MTRTDILEEINKLPPEERLQIVEATLRGLREQIPMADSARERRREMSIAAERLKGDYAADSDLTAFTTLDADDNDAAR
jgi:hypothetical protein